MERTYGVVGEGYVQKEGIRIVCVRKEASGALRGTDLSLFELVEGKSVEDSA